MRAKCVLFGGVAIAIAAIASSASRSTLRDDRLKVPNGLAFSEFKGYEGWNVVAVSNGGRLAVILGNPVAISAYKAGIPGNGRRFPDGSKMAKIHWDPQRSVAEPGQPLVPGALHDVDFMVKDSKRFADSGGWGYAEFEYQRASHSYRPGTVRDEPPQNDDAKCGFACHTIVRSRDYVFTQYASR